MTSQIITRAIITAVVAYLLGSFSFAVIFTKMSTHQDIREMGSKNAGFTNVLRTVGKGPAILTISFDFIKGIIAVLIGWWIFSGIDVADPRLLSEYMTYGRYFAGLFAIIGHMYPLYFGFKGGKGVVTTSALMAVVDWRVFILILATFGIMLAITKIVSLSSMTCAAMFAVYTFLMTYFIDRLIYDYSMTYVIASTICSLLIGVFVIIKHKDNIKRLIKGEEKKISAKK